MARIGKNQLVKLQSKYLTDESIANLYGITRQAVHRLRTKYGIPPVAEKHHERNEEIIRLYNQGISGTKIAKRLEMSVTQTYRILRAAGISLPAPGRK